MRLHAMKICERKVEPLAHMYIAFYPGIEAGRFLSGKMKWL